MMRTITILGLAGLLALQCPAQKNGSTPDKEPSAQTADAVPKKFYQLNFVSQELENERVINSRSYSMILRGGGAERGAIRSGQTVPYSSKSGANAEWHQIDVGVNIDCRKLEELGGQVSLSITADISSVIEGHGEAGLPSSLPIVRHNRWESTVLLPVKKPTILFSSDDPASKRKMQLLLTVTPILQD